MTNIRILVTAKVKEKRMLIVLNAVTLSKAIVHWRNIWKMNTWWRQSNAINVTYHFKLNGDCQSTKSSIVKNLNKGDVIISIQELNAPSSYLVANLPMKYQMTASMAQNVDDICVNSDIEKIKWNRCQIWQLDIKKLIVTWKWLGSLKQGNCGVHPHSELVPCYVLPGEGCFHLERDTRGQFFSQGCAGISLRYV